MEHTILDVKNINHLFQNKKETTQAVSNVSFSVREGECVGLIGESGSGKTTVANLISGMLPIQQGSIAFMGESIAECTGKKRKEVYQDMQMVFQNPMESFSPKMRLDDGIAEGLHYYTKLSKRERRKRAIEVMKLVGLREEYASKHCMELSGGECQRAAIGRAIILQPKLLICDEVTSALDVSIQAQIMHLLYDLKEEFKLSYLFISHDLALVSSICDRVCVMYQGEIVEEGPALEVIQNPQQEYTRKLIDSILKMPEKKEM